MGQYKVPQNVEAEDKIIGNLTLKEFIYTVIGVGCGIVSFLLLKNYPLLLVTVGLPPTLLFLMLGLFKRQDQPFEQLFLALVNYQVSPRLRLWNKEPIAEVFKVEPKPTVVKAPSQDPAKIQGELEKLAQIVDTRGWAAKQPEIQEPSGTGVNLADRLVPGEVVTPAPQPIDVHAADDILDTQNNPQAHNITTLIQNHSQSIRQEALAHVQQQKQAGPQPNPTTLSPSHPTKTAILKPDYEGLSVAQVAKQANKPLAEGQSVELRGGNG